MVQSISPVDDRLWITEQHVAPQSLEAVECPGRTDIVTMAIALSRVEKHTPCGKLSWMVAADDIPS